MSAPVTPAVSSHAKLRLLQRAGVDSGTVIDAWQSAAPIDIEYRDYHHAKHHDQLDVILLEDGGVVTTVLRAAYEHFMEESR